MDDCDETLRELEAFLDEELSHDTKDAIRTHLEGCPDCWQAFDFYAELKLVIAEKCRRDEMPPGLLGRIERCFDE
jgi:anti-sigma factor (TIGR02949 family)